MIYIYIYMIYIYIYVCMHACMYVCMYVCIYYLYNMNNIYLVYCICLVQNRDGYRWAHSIIHYLSSLLAQ